MEEYKNSPEWRLSCRVGRRIYQMTQDKDYNSVVRTLREHAGKLPVTIATASMNQNEKLYADSLKETWRVAHDIEYLLFYCWDLKELDHSETVSLLKLVYLIKSIIVKKLHHEQTAPF